MDATHIKLYGLFRMDRKGYVKAQIATFVIGGLLAVAFALWLWQEPSYVTLTLLVLTGIGIVLELVETVIVLRMFDKKRLAVRHN